MPAISCESFRARTSAPSSPPGLKRLPGLRSINHGTVQPAKVAPFARGAQPAVTELMSDKRAGTRLVHRRSTRRVPSMDGQAHKRAGARLVDRRSTRRVPSRDGQGQKAPQATFSNEVKE